MKTILFLSAFLLLYVAASAQPWYQIPTGTTKQLNSISFPSSSVGYIGGNDSLLLKSIDGGQSWSELNYTGVTFNPGADSILEVKFVSELIGYMTVGNYGGVYKTINGGLAWVEIIPAGILCFVEGLFFFDENNGFVGGAGCFQGETIDKMTGGVMSTTTINTPSLDASDLVVDIDFLNTGFGLAASHSGYILRTTNGGTTWDTIPTGLNSGVPLTSVAIVDDTLAYAGYNDLGSGFGILRTIDAGLTWTQDINSATFYYPAFHSVHVAGNGNVYSGAQTSWGTSGLIFESTGAVLWNYYDVDQPIYGMASYNGSTVFGVGDSGYVVVNQIPSSLSVFEDQKEQEALMVYPNPVKNNLTIQIPERIVGHVYSIGIFNLAGQEIYSVQTNSSTIEVGDLTSGIYFVRLTSENNSWTAKIVKQ
jgi:photosystem II stability/assembly factor-like uncharacterized protein